MKVPLDEETDHYDISLLHVLRRGLKDNNSGVGRQDFSLQYTEEEEVGFVYEKPSIKKQPAVSITHTAPIEMRGEVDSAAGVRTAHKTY